MVPAARHLVIDVAFRGETTSRTRQDRSGLYSGRVSPLRYSSPIRCGAIRTPLTHMCLPGLAAGQARSSVPGDVR